MAWTREHVPCMQQPQWTLSAHTSRIVLPAWTSLGNTLSIPVYIVNRSMMPHIDYCNSLLFGLQSPVNPELINYGRELSLATCLLHYWGFVCLRQVLPNRLQALNGSDEGPALHYADHNRLVTARAQIECGDQSYAVACSGAYGTTSKQRHQSILPRRSFIFLLKKSYPEIWVWLIITYEVCLFWLTPPGLQHSE